MIVCQVCGTQNPDGARFCDGCGVELAAKPMPTIPESRETPLPENSTFEQTVVAPTPPLPDPVQADPVLEEPLSETPGTTDQPVSSTPSSGDAGSFSESPASGGAVVEETLTDVSSPVTATETPLQDSASGPISPESTPSSLPEPAPVEPPVESSPAPFENTSAPAEPQPEVPTSVPVPTPDQVQSSAPKAAKLGIKKYGVLSGEAIPLGAGVLTLGRFDASTGPVDIDVTGLPGSEHVSRRHAQLQFENGEWLVKDLGSTNGVFVRRAGEVNFGPRIAEPTPLHPGDELAFGNLLMIYQED